MDEIHPTGQVLAKQNIHIYRHTTCQKPLFVTMGDENVYTHQNLRLGIFSQYFLAYLHIWENRKSKQSSLTYFPKHGQNVQLDLMTTCNFFMQQNSTASWYLVLWIGGNKPGNEGSVIIPSQVLLLRFNYWAHLANTTITLIYRSPVSPAFLSFLTGTSDWQE
jgi:hypothetical protein